MKKEFNNALGTNNSKRYFALSLFLIFVFFINGGNVASQNFSDQTFLITDLTNTAISGTVISSELSVPWTGLFIQLEIHRNGNGLALSGGDVLFPFDTFAKAVIDLKESRGLIPLFIDYNGPVRELNEAFVSTGLSEYIYFLPPGERWPLMDEIQGRNKNIIVFTFQKPSPGNSIFHYAWDYIAEFPHSGIEDPQFDGHYINGDITKELLMVRDLNIPPSIVNQRQLLLDINQNQFYINHLLNRWKNTGKKPNFIFAGRNSRYFSPLIPWLNTYKSVKGVARINDRPVEKIFWKHSNKCITNGYFCFPYSEGEELNLTPFCPGFRFDPQTFIVSPENLIMSLTFSASPLSMDEGLVAYFPFDNNWHNYVDPAEAVIPANASFISDVNKGEVAKLPDSSYIVIGGPENYGIRNNSFSVSAWFKLNEVADNGEYSILGTPEGVFRKGLHLVIRQGRPYFGFYGNDLWADRIVTPNEWFHIVYRYNYFNGEQAIYVNGQNVGASFNHASFIGDSTLVIGRSISARNFLNGYIDDLYIWNRPIGEEEILFLYNSEYIPEIENGKKQILPGLLIPVVIIILVIVAILFIFRKGKRKRVKTGQTKLAGQPERRDKNALYLFGDFQIFNSRGEELSGVFTPKILELFLLVLLFSIKNKKGIKTETLTSVLWPGFPTQKAANNRSVTFNKLRRITENVKGLEVTHRSGYWSVDLEKGFCCDYLEAFAILKKSDIPSRAELEQFFYLVKKGVFLNEIHWEWLDEFRGHIANEVIDNLMLYASKLNENEDCHLLKAIAERILVTDDLNEKALQFIIRQLLSANNTSQARFRFSQFTANYEKTYGESYRLSFDEFKEKEF